MYNSIQGLKAMIHLLLQAIDSVVANQDSLNILSSSIQRHVQHANQESLVVRIDPQSIDSLLAAIEASASTASKGITLTDVASLVGVIFGLSGLVLGILNYLRDRGNVTVSLEWDRNLMNAPGYDESKLWGVVTVTHIGRRPIYISHAAIKLPQPSEYLLLSEGIKGEKLSEGDPPRYFMVNQAGLEKYASVWHKLRAQVSDTTGKVYLSSKVKTKPSWANVQQAKP